MTQQELADLVGVSPQQIGFYEAEVNWPGRTKWPRIAEALEVPVGDLLGQGVPLDLRAKGQRVTKGKRAKEA